MFSDGKATAGSVYIETMKESEHVKIHFPYLEVTIDIIKVNFFPSLNVILHYCSSNCDDDYWCCCGCCDNGFSCYYLCNEIILR